MAEEHSLHKCFKEESKDQLRARIFKLEKHLESILRVASPGSGHGFTPYSPEWNFVVTECLLALDKIK